MKVLHNSGYLYYLIFFNLFFSFTISAQVSSIGIDELYRTQQLLGNFDSSHSFTIRPLSGYKTVFNPASINHLINDTIKQWQRVKEKSWQPVFKKVPFQLTQQLNTHHPYGWNDGAMIASNGYQLFTTVGIYASSGPFEIQLQPEFVLAANSHYETSDKYGTVLKNAYLDIFPGQSYVKYSLGKLAVNLSTENIWWGPGRKSSLLMSNNAPGFTHFSFQTNSPIKTPIGHFEWQLFGGWLKSKDSLPYEQYHLRANSQTFFTDTRYLNGLAISYQPKWIPGMFIGFNRNVQTYSKDYQGAPSGFLEKYFPVLLLAVQKKNTQSEDSLFRDQMASFFLRWVFPKDNFEFYTEYGFNDYGLNIRDYLLSPSHSAAYIFGFRKIIPKSNLKRIELGFEITHMSQSPDGIVRDAPNWYQHGQIMDGYTHNNQIMGTAAGSGANILSFDATWVDGWKRIGILFEKVERDPYARLFKWIDFAFGIVPQYKFNNYVFSGIFQFISSKHYMWSEDKNRLNIHAQLSISYSF